VSNALPAVLRWSVPSAGAVHVHHTDAPPSSPAWSGSPGCLVANALSPLTSTSTPFTSVAAAKSSFGGGVPWRSERAIVPVALSFPSTAIRYTVSRDAVNVTCDCGVPPESSLEATVDSKSIDVPTYTPSSVSKLLPARSIVTVPSAGARQRHQTDRAPYEPAW
jgi:hypothetical protein